MSSALPTMVIRVGVTGHRPNRIRVAEERLALRVKDVLECVSDAAKEARASQPKNYRDDVEAVRRFTSGLAPGADVISAEVAHAAGWDLQTVLAFERTQFETRAIRDNPTIDAAAYGAKLTTLLDASTSVFEIDGLETGGLRRDAYELVGDVTLEQSDVVIALWDGEPARGLGGTAHLVRVARERGLPLVWINTVADVPPEVYLPGRQNAVGLPSLALWIHDSLRLADTAVESHGGSDKRDASTRWHNFLHENAGRTTRFLPFFQWLLMLGGKSRPRWRLRKSDSSAAAHAKWPEFGAKLRKFDSTLAKAVDVSLQHPFEQADYLAERYGRAYRGTYVLIYLLASLATFVGLLSLVVTAWPKVVFVSIELIVIVGAGILATVGRRRHWHSRWLEYRAIAELLRQARIGVWCGQSLEPSRIEGDAAHAGESWVAWYVRARVRELPLIKTRATSDYLAAAAQSVIDHEIAPQLKFNGETSEFHAKVHHRLEWLEIGLFIILVAACVLFIESAFVVAIPGCGEALLPASWIESAPKFMTLLGALIPAIGAALLGVRSQGEFAANAERMKSTAERLKPARARAQTLTTPDAASDFQDIVDLCDLTGAALADDVFAWRLVFRRKQLTVAA